MTNILHGHDGLTQPELVALYEAVGWSAYTRDPDALMRAVRGASDVWLARDGEGALVGLARVLTDDVSILYLQDILVAPSHQRRGVGRDLMRVLLQRYAHVRQKVLLTDDRPEQHAFYASLGYTDTRTLQEHPLHAFVRIEGVTLT